MKWYKKTAIVLLVALVGIQFIPTARNQSDVVPATDFMMVNEVPKAINDKLQGSCYDCHSNNTRYPWYSNIQPGPQVEAGRSSHPLVHCYSMLAS